MITAGEIDRPYDVVVVAIKSYALEQAMLDMAPAVGPRTVVVPLLNGMRHIDELVGAFGEEHVYGGVCMIHATLDDAGDVVQLTGLHRLGFGPLDGDDDGRLKAVTEALSGAGFDSKPSATIVQDMWEKWVFLAGLGAATTLMRATVGAINAAPGGPAFMAGIADEVVVGGRRGRSPPPGRRGGVPARRRLVDRADHVVALPRHVTGAAGGGRRDHRRLRDRGGEARGPHAAAVRRVHPAVDLCRRPGRGKYRPVIGPSRARYPGHR